MEIRKSFLMEVIIVKWKLALIEEVMKGAFQERENLCAQALRQGGAWLFEETESQE